MIILTSEAQEILEWYKDTYSEFRTPQEYGRNAFWHWYDQISNEIRNLETVPLPYGIHLVYHMDYWGDIVYTKSKVNSDSIITIETFLFDNGKFADWLLHIARNIPPYSVCDKCFGYSSVLYDQSQKYGILKPNGTKLTEPIFDEIINFHHSSDNYNKIHAIGFIGDRVYEILMDGHIDLLHISKNDYLSMKHRYDEMLRKRINIIIENLRRQHNIRNINIRNNNTKRQYTMKQRIRLTEGDLRRIIRKCINEERLTYAERISNEIEGGGMMIS